MKNITDMTYTIGFVIRIYPSEKQKHIIAKNAGAARFIYNRLVMRGRELHALKKVKIYCEPIANRIVYLESLGEKPSELEAAYPFLDDKGLDSQMVANAVKNYHQAWANYRNVPGTGIPALHKKGYVQSYQTNPHYKAGATLITECNVHLGKDKHHITLPKLGGIRFKCSDWFYGILSRKCETRIGAIRILKNAAGEYYASLQIGSDQPFHKKLRSTGHSVGIDMNLENFYTDSDGKVVENPRIRKGEQDKFAKAQKKLSRRAERAKKEGRKLAASKNYQKQRVKAAKMNLAVQRRREAFQHEESKRVIESQDAVFVENLKVKNLVKNHHLAFAISDVTWGGFLCKLEYKAKFYGRKFLRVSDKNTTQQCSHCGYVLTGDEKLTLKDREWTCPKCGTHHVRDHNAAKNIKARGLALLVAQST